MCCVFYEWVDTKLSGVDFFILFTLLEMKHFQEF